MRWLNIEIATLRCPSYIGAEPVERATWLSLLGYCADQENGGRIRSCKRWKDRQWQQVCGITQAEAQASSELWHYDGDDIVVAFYPVEREAEMKAKRKAGSIGGIASGKARKKPQVNHAAEAQLEAELEAQHEADLEGKGMERNTMEGKVVGQQLGLGIAEPSQQPKVKKLKTKAPKTIDEALIVELINDPAYEGIDVRKECAKMVRWYKTHGKQATPRKLVAWLNRAEVPTKLSGDAPEASNRPMRPYEAKLKADAIRKMIERISSDYSNKVQSKDSYQWTLKPEAKAEIAALRAKLRELDQIMVE